jgi:hypothetical protein
MKEERVQLEGAFGERNYERHVNILALHHYHKDLLTFTPFTNILKTFNIPALQHYHKEMLIIFMLFTIVTTVC